jgi:hypothetical protein
MAPPVAGILCCFGRSSTIRDLGPVALALCHQRIYIADA